MVISKPRWAVLVIIVITMGEGFGFAPKGNTATHLELGLGAAGGFFCLEDIFRVERNWD